MYRLATKRIAKTNKKAELLQIWPRNALKIFDSPWLRPGYRWMAFGLRTAKMLG